LLICGRTGLPCPCFTSRLFIEEGRREIRSRRLLRTSWKLSIGISYQSEFLQPRLSLSNRVIVGQVAPYLTLFINGTGWSPLFPRLMTNDQLAVTLERAKEVGRGRFVSVGDISCDIEVRWGFWILLLPEVVICCAI